MFRPESRLAPSHGKITVMIAWRILMNTRRSYLGHDIPGYTERLLKAISRYGLPPGASRAWFRDPDFQAWNSLGYMQPSGSIYWQTYLYAALQAAGVDQHRELSTITILDERWHFGER